MITYIIAVISIIIITTIIYYKLSYENGFFSSKTAFSIGISSIVISLAFPFIISRINFIIIDEANIIFTLFFDFIIFIIMVFVLSIVLSTFVIRKDIAFNFKGTDALNELIDGKNNADDLDDIGYTNENFVDSKEIIDKMRLDDDSVMEELEDEEEAEEEIEELEDEEEAEEETEELEDEEEAEEETEELEDEEEAEEEIEELEDEEEAEEETEELEDEEEAEKEIEELEDEEEAEEESEEAIENNEIIDSEEKEELESEIAGLIDEIQEEDEPSREKETMSVEKEDAVFVEKQTDIEYDNDKTFEEYVSKAFEFKNEGNFDEAILQFTQALENSPDEESVFWIVLDICTIYKKLGQVELAKDILESYFKEYGNSMNDYLIKQIENNLK